VNFNHRRIQIALSFIQEYSGDIPFSIYLRRVFRRNQNWGSKDRKFYRNISYIYWRIIHQIETNDDDEIIDYLLTQIENNPPLETSPYLKFELDLTKDLNHNQLCKWFNIQAPVFLYILNEKYTLTSGLKTDIKNSFSFNADTKLDEYVNNGFGIIQDWSSTASIKYLLEKINPTSIWETCAGAGGKSIVLMNSLDIDRSLHYTSDIRESILDNLRNRFLSLGFKAPETQIIDLSDEDSISKFPKVDIVIADMPCSGSGTWRRTPERATFCTNNEIINYSEKQLKYLFNIANNNKHNYIYYMTCSIFKAENEEVINNFTTRYSNYSVEWKKLFHTSQYGGSDFIFGCLLRRLD